MASASPTGSPTSLEDLVSCSICLENFTDPRALPCVHSYCKACLERLMTPQGIITCPQCRLEFQVPNRDVSNFRPNFIVNNLLELSSLNTVVTGSCSSGNQPTLHCQRHTDRSCELYCENCAMLICYLCIVKWGECHQHTYKDPKEIVGELHEKVKKYNRKGEERLTTIRQHLALLEDLRAKQVANVSEIYDNINEAFTRHVSRIEARRTQLVEEANALHQQNVEGLNNEFERIQIEMAKVVSTSELSRKMLDIQDPVAFTQQYNDVKEKIFGGNREELVSEVDVHVLKFTEDDSFLASVLLSYGRVQDVSRGEEKEESQSIENKRKPDDFGSGKPKSQKGKRESIGSTPGTSGTTRVATQEERSPSKSASIGVVGTSAAKPIDNTPVQWKLYPKNYTDHWIKLEEKGLLVRTECRKFVSVIGMPGCKTGTHTWKVKLENPECGFGVGVCLGKNKPALCVMFDSPLRRYFAIVVAVDLDCEKGLVQVTPEGHHTSLLQFPIQNNVVHPYFVLFPSDKTGSLTVVEMDGKSADDRGSCCIL